MTRISAKPQSHVTAKPAVDRALDRRSVPAGSTREDVSTFDVNPKHPGYGQSERIGLRVGQIRVAATPFYDGEGNPQGTVSPTSFGKAHSGGINAGAITDLKLKPQGGAAATGAPVKCVWVWDVATSKGPASGWVPLDAISPRKAVEQIQADIARRIAAVRGRDPIHHVTRQVVAPSARDRATTQDLYTFPHQTTHENKAKYYFGGSSEEPLFLDVPKPGDSGRFGISNDVMPTGTHFHVDTLVPPERVPLYKANSAKVAGNLRFVYGYFVNDAGQKRFGWTNEDSLKRT
jgi:hypothetical protein